MSEFTIEKDVPAPKPAKQRNHYPFREMEVGDSFFVEPMQQPTIKNAASLFGTRNNRKYTIRRVEGGYRCWRIA